MVRSRLVTKDLESSKLWFLVGSLGFLGHLLVLPLRRAFEWRIIKLFLVKLLLYDEAWRQVWGQLTLNAAAKRLEKCLVLERVPHHLVALLTHL